MLHYSATVRSGEFTEVRTTSLLSINSSHSPPEGIRFQRPAERRYFRGSFARSCNNPTDTGILLALDLDKVHVVSHPPIGPDLSLFGKEILDRQLAHFCRHFLAVIAVRQPHCPQIMEGCRINAGMYHGRHRSSSVKESHRPTPRLVIPIPIETIDESHALGGVETKNMNIRDVDEQGRQRLR